MKKLITLFALTFALCLLPEYSFSQLKEHETVLSNRTNVVISESHPDLPLKSGDTRYYLFLREDGNVADILTTNIEESIRQNMVKFQDKVDERGGIHFRPSMIFDGSGPTIQVVVEYKKGIRHLFFEVDDSSTDNSGRRVVRISR